MYIIGGGGGQLKFVYMRWTFFFGRGHSPPKGQRGSTPVYIFYIKEEYENTLKPLNIGQKTSC